MPPKKKDDKSRVSQPADAADEQKVAIEAELLVSVLKSRLGRYQEAGEKLAVEGYKLADELAKQKLTLQDINEFLTSELKARSVAATQMEERVVELNKQMQEVQKEAQAEVARAHAEAAALVSAAEGRVQSLAAQLQGSADFLERREQLENQLIQCKEQLAARQKEAEQKLSDMERRHLQDKEKMRQEMTAKIKETKITMAQLADQHLETSTKRTLVENEALAAELSYHSAQSSRLAEANSTLRDEAAELRRQLAVAQKTVESTARKNLLLQQTIKAILKCLQEERSPGAAAAAAGLYPQQLQELATLSLRNPDFGVGSNSKGAQQQQQQQEQGHAVLAAQQCLLAACQANTTVLAHTEVDHAARDFDSNYKQPQATAAPAAADVASDIVMQLQHKVVNLADELDAARQALAAAMQGMMPETAAGRVSIMVQHKGALQQSAAGSHTHHDAIRPASEGTSSSSSRLLPGCGPYDDHGGALESPRGAGLQVSVHNSSSPSTPVSGGRSRHRSRNSPSTKGQQGPAVWEGGGGGGRFTAEAHTAAQPGPGAAAVAAAIEDGVAAFVLFCVQQLRRGSQQGSAAVASTGASGAAAAGSTVCSGGNKPSHRTCSSPTGKGRQSARAAAAVTVRSVSPSVLGSGFDCHSVVGYEAAGNSSTTDADTAPAAALDEGAAREQLARLLLDQLHGYARHKVAVFQGLHLVLPAPAGNIAGPQHQQQGSILPLEMLQSHSEMQATTQDRAAAGPTSSSRGHRQQDGSPVPKLSSSQEFDSVTQLLLSRPSQQPVMSLTSSGAAPNSTRSSALSPHEPFRTSASTSVLQLLPPLPSLLATIQQQRSSALGMDAASPSSQCSAAEAAILSPGPCTGCRNNLGTRPSIEDLFGALLVDPRPWGVSSQPTGAGDAASEGSPNSMRNRALRSPSPSRCSLQSNRCPALTSSPKATRHAVVSNPQSSV